MQLQLTVIITVAGINSNAINVAHNVTITIICTTNGHHTPDWFVNGTEVLTRGDSPYRVSTSDGIWDKTATLTINGNYICSTLYVHCEVYKS